LDEDLKVLQSEIDDISKKRSQLPIIEDFYENLPPKEKLETVEKELKDIQKDIDKAVNFLDCKEKDYVKFRDDILRKTKPELKNIKKKQEKFQEEMEKNGKRLEEAEKKRSR